MSDEKATFAFVNNPDNNDLIQEIQSSFEHGPSVILVPPIDSSCMINNTITYESLRHSLLHII